MLPTVVVGCGVIFYGYRKEALAPLGWLQLLLGRKTWKQKSGRFDEEPPPSGWARITADWAVCQLPTRNDPSAILLKMGSDLRSDGAAMQMWCCYGQSLVSERAQLPTSKALSQMVSGTGWYCFGVIWRHPWKAFESSLSSSGDEYIDLLICQEQNVVFGIPFLD